MFGDNQGEILLFELAISGLRRRGYLESEGVAPGNASTRCDAQSQRIDRGRLPGELTMELSLGSCTNLNHG